MNKAFWSHLLLIVAIGYVGCSTPTDPQIVPPQPQFVDSTQPPNPVDHRIYADVDAQHDAIVIEWKLDTTNNTSGYILYRSNDSLVGSDGVLMNGTVLAKFESSNPLGESLPNSYQDTTGIIRGGIYWYQLRAFYRSPTNNLTYSQPTHVDVTTSFQYAARLVQQAPAGRVSLPPNGLQFRWENPPSPEHSGQYQIIVQRTDNHQFVCSHDDEGFGGVTTATYPPTATSLVNGASYRWRVKRLVPNGGSSSVWMTFTVSP